MPAARARTPVTPAGPTKPRSDVYVGLLILALLAQLGGAAFLYMDYSQYPETKPPKVQDRTKGASAPAPGIPAIPPPPAGVGGNPPGGMGGMGGNPPPAPAGDKAPMGKAPGMP
jgi:hypothetical protein